MARRRTSNRGRSGTNRRRLFWARRTALSAFTAADRAASYNLLADFETAYGADLFGFTVTRIIGHYTYWTTSNTGVATTYNVSTGIRVDDESEIDGSTEAEQIARLPVNDPFTDWMFARNNIGVTTTTGDPAQGFQLALNRVDLDLRSQRRLDELGQSLYWFVGLNASPGSDVNVWWDFHILCKRP